jgi:hypothetical protein
MTREEKTKQKKLCSVFSTVYVVLQCATVATVSYGSASKCQVSSRCGSSSNAPLF